MSRRFALLAFVGLGMFGLACAKPKAQPPARPSSGKAPRHPGKLILIFMPSTPPAESVWEGLRGELSSEFELELQRLPPDASVDNIADAIEKVQPECIVLMNNATVRLYWQYQQAQPSNASFPPAVIVMSSFLHETYRSIKNATGISYEVPGVVQFVRLRSIIDRPVRKVGVIYRSQFAAFVGAQQKLARVEEVELVGKDVGREPSQDEISAALVSLLQKDRVDAMWVLNDNGLLSTDVITSAWLPNLTGNDRVPVIVGVRSLLNKEHPLGSFAMLPDHIALGVQAANLVLDLADNGWKLGSRTVEFPISMKTVVDVELVRRQFGFKKGGLDKIDQIVE